MTTTPAPCQIEKTPSGVWILTGVYAVIAARRVDEAFELAFRNKREAEARALRIDRANAEGLVYLAERNAARRAEAEAYLAARRARRAPEGHQMAFGF